MVNNLVSVIMPAYNADKYINQAIKSVCEQTYTNWELIVVDDGSTDETASIIKAHSLKDKRVTYLFQDRGRQGKSRNLGINNSKGDYIAFLDADDLWVNTKLQTQINIMRAMPAIGLLFSCGYNLLTDGSIYEVNIKTQKWCWINNEDEFINANQIPLLSVMVTRKAITAVNLFTEKIEIQNGAEDYHLWIKLLKHTEFLSIQDKLFYYRIHPEQVTKRYNTEIAILNCLYDLAISDIIDKSNKTLRERMKWFVFHAPDLELYLKMLQNIFFEKKIIIAGITGLNKLLPNSAFIKRLIFHSL